MISDPKVTGIWEHLNYSLSDYFQRSDRQNPDSAELQRR